MRLIARLDVKNGNLIKTINLEGLRKLGNCKDYALKYFHDDIDELFLSDPVASLYERDPLYSLLDDITDDIFIPITISGGIRTIKDIRKLLLIGADKIAINTSAIENPNFINESVAIFGSQSIAISIQVKYVDNNWYCYTNCGRDNSGKKLNLWLQEIQERGAGEIIITSVNREGLNRGLDISLLNYVKDLIQIPLTISGGFGSLKHLDELTPFKEKLSGIAIAGSLHYKKMDIYKIREYSKKLGLKMREI